MKVKVVTFSISQHLLDRLLLVVLYFSNLVHHCALYAADKWSSMYVRWLSQWLTFIYKSHRLLLRVHTCVYTKTNMVCGSALSQFSTDVGSPTELRWSWANKAIPFLLEQCTEGLKAVRVDYCELKSSLKDQENIALG